MGKSQNTFWLFQLRPCQAVPLDSNASNEAQIYVECLWQQHHQGSKQGESMLSYKKTWPKYHNHCTGKCTRFIFLHEENSEIKYNVPDLLKFNSRVYLLPYLFLQWSSLAWWGELSIHARYRDIWATSGLQCKMIHSMQIPIWLCSFCKTSTVHSTKRKVQLATSSVWIQHSIQMTLNRMSITPIESAS